MTKALHVVFFFWNCFNSHPRDEVIAGRLLAVKRLTFISHFLICYFTNRSGAWEIVLQEAKDFILAGAHYFVEPECFFHVTRISHLLLTSLMGSFPLVGFLRYLVAFFKLFLFPFIWYSSEFLKKITFYYMLSFFLNSFRFIEQIKKN